MADVRCGARLALERALEAGDLVPGSRGWRQRIVRVVEDFLATHTAGSTVPFRWRRPAGARGRWAFGPPEASQSVLAPVLLVVDPSCRCSTKLSVPAEAADSLGV
jgi:hypothetical protein